MAAAPSFYEQFTATTIESHKSWEKKENPQAFDRFASMEIHPRPTQHMLGIVGGNEVGIPNWGKMRDIESDLRGTTRALTDAPARQHQPAFLHKGATTVKRNTPKETVTVDIRQRVLPQSQMWAYPATLAPEPFVHETCGQPWKY
jgi:hypothetical protein